jgi:hypothetical protein
MFISLTNTLDLPELWKIITSESLFSGKPSILTVNKKLNASVEQTKIDSTFDMIDLKVNILCI